MGLPDDPKKPPAKQPIFPNSPQHQNFSGVSEKTLAILKKAELALQIDTKQIPAKKTDTNLPAQKPQSEKLLVVSERTKAVLEKAALALQQKNLGILIDATASRSPTWERAQRILQSIFDRLCTESDLRVRVVYFRGGEIGDLGWNGDLPDVARRMGKVQCSAGRTKIIKGLTMLCQGAESVILIGDSFEEGIGSLESVLAEYARKKIRIFSFFEGSDHVSRDTFKTISAATGGVFQEYREGVSLNDLMMAVAAYAAQGLGGLEKLVKENSAAAHTIQKELLRIESKTRK